MGIQMKRKQLTRTKKPLGLYVLNESISALQVLTIRVSWGVAQSAALDQYALSHSGLDVSNQDTYVIHAALTSSRCRLYTYGYGPMPSQQIRDYHPMLVHCWAAVVDGGPTVDQHWVNVSGLLGSLHSWTCLWLFSVASTAANKRRWFYVGLTSGLRLWRWPNNLRHLRVHTSPVVTVYFLPGRTEGNVSQHVHYFQLPVP